MSPSCSWRLARGRGLGYVALPLSSKGCLTTRSRHCHGGGPVPSTEGRASALAGILTRLSESCRQLDQLSDNQALLLRAERLSRDVSVALGRRQAGPPTALPALAVNSLGRFHLTRGGQALAPCSARKSIGVFRYLLTRADCVAYKEELAESIWPESSPKEAAHRLHVAISTLRHYLDSASAESYLLSAAGWYRINPAAQLTEDAAIFKQNIIQANRLWNDRELDDADRAYTRAIDSYGGDYCVADLDFSWASCEREHLLNGYLTAMYRLGRLRLRQRRYEDAAECLNRLLDRDCYREDVHFHLMYCYCLLGRRWQAVQQYLKCRELLESALGLSPTPKLRDLYEAILESREKLPGLEHWEDPLVPADVL
jgi:DNA-binding SARP family transcriptional activator